MNEADAPLLGRSWKRWAPIVFVLALGMALRAVQYFGHVDMWYDELAIARNIEDRGVLELLRPLEHFQVAPFGFLAMVDATTAVLGVTVAGLRLGPWLFGLASLFLFWRVAERFAEGSSLLAVLTLFAVSPALIWFGQSVKPYIGDVAITLALVWLSLRYLERPEDTRRALAAAAAGAVLLQFSFPAVPTAAILGALLLVDWLRRRPRPSSRPLLVLLGGWGAGAALAGFVASKLVDPATDAFMRVHWVAGFPPDSFPGALSWAASGVYGAFSHALIYLPPSNILLAAVVALPFGLGMAGLAVLARRQWLQAAILLPPPRRRASGSDDPPPTIQGRSTLPLRGVAVPRLRGCGSAGASCEGDGALALDAPDPGAGDGRAAPGHRARHGPTALRRAQREGGGRAARGGAPGR